MLSDDKPTQTHKELYLMEGNSPIMAFKKKGEYLKYFREISKPKNSRTIDINTYACLCRVHGRQANKTSLANIKNPRIMEGK